MIDIDHLLAWGATFKKIEAGEYIFREGTECHFYYQIVSGTVRWVNTNDDGREFIQDIISAGQCFGELPLFDDQPYAASAIANSTGLLLRLQKSSFLQLLEEAPHFHFAFSRQMTQQLRYKFFLLRELALCDPEHRIWQLFQYFKANNKNICTACNRVQLTRQQIADMTGMRVETVIRSIRTLHQKGMLVINRGKVYC